MQLIQYTPALRIVNVGQLSRGTGDEYLEVLVAHNGELIACQWRRSLVRDLPAGRALVQFIKPRKVALFACQECGKKFNTTAAARRATNDGCPKCGGCDIDLV